MSWAQRKAWACGVVALGLAVGWGAVASRAQQPPAEPAGRPAKGGQPAPGRDAELEALRKEVEALRRKIDALAPEGEPQRIVVTTPVVRDVALTSQYVAKIHARRHVQIRSLMTGYVSEVKYREGQAVKTGQDLIQLEPVLYRAKLEAERAEAHLAEVEYRNTKRLYEQKVVSVQEMQVFEAKLMKAQARVKLAEAEFRYTTIRAPFDGLVGRIDAQQGSLVREGDVVTTLSDTAVMWVYFNVPEAHYLRLAAGPTPNPLGKDVELVLADGQKFGPTGKLAAIEADFNAGAGTIPFRADFPNPDGLLRHGQTGTVKLTGEVLRAAVVIPQRATFEDDGRRYVLVVGQDSVARRLAVPVRAEVGDAFVVTGLEPSDRIVLDGVRQVRDGDKVEYEFVRPEGVTRPQPREVKE